MAATLVPGSRTFWGGKRDTDNHRNWTLKHLIRTSAANDGPATVLACPGLPTVGTTYAFGNDSDSWAFCYPDATIEMKGAMQDNTLTWEVQQLFSTRPLAKCNQLGFTDPLLEPERIGGSFVKYLKAATTDMNGLPILSSSWEPLRGREVEFEEAYPTVWVEKNDAFLGLETFTQYINCLNDSLMWGMNPRCIKLDNVIWRRQTYGLCYSYYTKRFELSINFNTFDKIAQDEGTKVLNGHFGTPGTGCTIAITAVNSDTGAITGASINAGGSGYTPNSTLTLAIASGSGDGASVTVITNGAGVVTSVLVISNGGSRYTTENVTTTGTGWILDNIGGSPPNPNNPQHFIRYKDRYGDCSRVILDGQGQPAINKYPGQILIQKYQEANLLSLGLPTSL